MTLEPTLNEYHRSLRPRYTENDNKTSANCVAIAYDIARQLIQQSREPRIYEVNPGYDDGYPQPGLTVKSFQSVTFYTHFFTSAQDEAYDPIQRTPVPIREYVEGTFEEDEVSLNLRASTDKIQEELHRRPHRYFQNHLA